MKDVSLLRAAFLKCAIRDNQQQAQTRRTHEANSPLQPPSTSSQWRTHPNSFGTPNVDPQAANSMNLRQQGAMVVSSRSREHNVARAKFHWDKEVANEAWILARKRKERIGVGGMHGPDENEKQMIRKLPFQPLQ
jgi:hypothetical protein